MEEVTPEMGLPREELAREHIESEGQGGQKAQVEERLRRPEGRRVAECGEGLVGCPHVFLL